MNERLARGSSHVQPALLIAMEGSLTAKSERALQYYFHVETDDGKSSRDETGQPFPDVSGAIGQALTIASELAADPGWHGAYVQVVNDRGIELAYIPVTNQPTT